MSCIVECNGDAISINPIPPRSVRPIPKHFISQKAKILQEQELNKSESLPSPTVENSQDELHLSIDGQWTGECSIRGVSSRTISKIKIGGTQINGWFIHGQIQFIFSGLLNPVNHVVMLTVYSELGDIFQNVRGTFIIQENSYVLNCRGDNITIVFSSDISALSQPSINPAVTGQYRGFDQRGSSSFEMWLDLVCTATGNVSAKGTEGIFSFKLFGLIDQQTSRFFFVKIRGYYETTFYVGNASLRDEIYFSGNWSAGTLSGGTSFIKYMQF